MRQFFIILILFLINGNGSFCQSFTDSNLPVIILNTDGEVEIPDNPRILADMKIIYRGQGQRNYLTDQNNSQYLNYNGRVDIEIRGTSSQGREKKQYGFTTLLSDNISKNNVSLLGLPEENDWILNGMVWDPSLIRDYLGYNISRQLGHYASRTVYCELIINGTYKGLYLLEEKIKADDNRVDIIELTTNDIYSPEVTGGYITKADKSENGEIVAWTDYDLNGEKVEYQHVYPKPEIITAQQNDYIHSQFENLATTTANNDASLVSGFPSIIDIPSFIDYIIINEIASNFDAYSYSTFFHKDRNGKLRAGPVWDLDQAFGNDVWGEPSPLFDVWEFSNGEHDGSEFWLNLFNNDLFRCYLSKRWNELIKPYHPLNFSSLETLIDKTVEVISEAVSRENEKWGTIGDFQQRITTIKSFLAARIDGITGTIGSFSECANVPAPPLVITKIMYHPAETSISPDGKDPEFIEITNNGDETVDLTGIYFSGTGFVYHFPANATIDPYSSLILASSSELFYSVYNTLPYDQFTRHLSNKSQNLVLVDAFGNVIDSVQYFDSDPWPDTDGNGYYLKLIDPGLNNNHFASWVASNDPVVSAENPAAEIEPKIYPNPVTDIVKIEADAILKTIILSDLYGRVLLTIAPNSESCDLDMGHFARGFYFIRCITTDQVCIRKVIKE